LLTDNEILATTANRRTIIHDLGHWTLRPLLVISHVLQKIGRATNKVADNLTKKARQDVIPSSCCFSCESLVHLGIVPFSQPGELSMGLVLPHLCILSLSNEILPFQKKDPLILRPS